MKPTCCVCRDDATTTLELTSEAGEESEVLACESCAGELERMVAAGEEAISLCAAIPRHTKKVSRKMRAALKKNAEQWVQNLRQNQGDARFLARETGGCNAECCRLK